MSRSIKHLKPNPKSHFKDGYFPLDKCKKYVGKDGEPCIYRSSLEFRVFSYCENHPSIKSWVSEPFPITYYMQLPNGKTKKHNYNIDLIIEFMDGKKWFVEVKPFSLTQKGSMNFEKNKAKWNASIEWCKQQDYDIVFRIITEKFNFNV